MTAEIEETARLDRATLMWHGKLAGSLGDERCPLTTPERRTKGAGPKPRQISSCIQTVTGNATRADNRLSLATDGR